MTRSGYSIFPIRLTFLNLSPGKIGMRVTERKGGVHRADVLRVAVGPEQDPFAPVGRQEEAGHL